MRRTVVAATGARTWVRAVDWAWPYPGRASRGARARVGPVHGGRGTGDGGPALGKSILKMERDFNTRAGFTKEDDRLPRFFLNEPIPPHNVTFMVKDEDLDQVFNW